MIGLEKWLCFGKELLHVKIRINNFARWSTIIWNLAVSHSSTCPATVLHVPSLLDSPKVYGTMQPTKCHSVTKFALCPAVQWSTMIHFSLNCMNRVPSCFTPLLSLQMVWPHLLSLTLVWFEGQMEKPMSRHSVVIQTLMHTFTLFSTEVPSFRVPPRGLIGSSTPLHVTLLLPL